MHGDLASNAQLIAGIDEQMADSSAVEIMVAPPAIYLAQVAMLLSGSRIALGAQNASEYNVGAYTGECSAQMLSELGCRYVIVGHSERRQLFGEDDERVAQKVLRVLEAGLTPVLCVGESLDEHVSGRTQEVVDAQIAAVLRHCSVSRFASLVVAYEPVWAIGTGRTATPEHAQLVHHAIRQHVAAHDAMVAEGLRILYGGSVKAGNAAEMFAQPDIDGALVGGASLKADEFVAICRAATV